MAASSAAAQLGGADPYQDPTTVTETKALLCPAPSYTISNFESESHGKWLLLRNFEDIYRCWCQIRDQVISEGLGAGVTGAECSTLMYNPMQHGTGPKTTGRIAVFTTEETSVQVGMRLIQLDVVKHDIVYKTTESKKYAHIPDFTIEPVTSMTIFWDNGHFYRSNNPERARPRFPCRDDKNPLTDEWKINIVKGNAEYANDAVSGKWILVSNYKEESEFNITKLWHTLRKKIKSGEIAAVKMECPPQAAYRDKLQPEVHVFASEVNTNVVEYKLRSIVEHRIKMEWHSKMEK